MKIEGKIWGETKEIINCPFFEIHRIEVEAGGYCSLHKHEHKYNAFYVESGELEIVIHKKDYNLKDATIIKTGELTIVKPGEFHIFTATVRTIAYEIYWVDGVQPDIIRKTVGGIIGE